LKFNQQNIIEEIKKGNALAFKEMYNLYYTSLCRFAFKYFENSIEAEDIVQEIMAKLWEQRETLQINNLNSYLFTAIKHSCLNRLNHLKVIQKHIDATSFELKLLELEYDNDFVLDEKQEREKQVLQAIDELPEQRKKIIGLKYFEGKKAKEIAEITNLSVRTVETHIYKGLKTLTNKFKNGLTLFILLLNMLF